MNIQLLIIWKLSLQYILLLQIKPWKLFTGRNQSVDVAVVLHHRESTLTWDMYQHFSVRLNLYLQIKALCAYKVLEIRVFSWWVIAIACKCYFTTYIAAVMPLRSWGAGCVLTDPERMGNSPAILHINLGAMRCPLGLTQQHLRSVLAYQLVSDCFGGRGDRAKWIQFQRHFAI